MRRLLAPILLALVLATGISAAGAQDANRSITQIKGDVYRFQNNFHYAIFVVTDAGIVVTDPINADAVTWLKAELSKRFDKPVTHMVLSHHHADHASGGEAWGNIEVVAHENTKKHVAAGKVKTAMPTKTFSDKHTLTVGNKTLELTYLGVGHGDDLIAMVVRPENVAFVVDAVSPKRLPWRDFPHTDIDGMINQIKAVEALDFDILAPGHSVMGTKQDATDVRVYIETLKAGVMKGLKDGKSVEDILATDLVTSYKDWGAYDRFRELNTRGMARWLKESGQVQ